MKKLLFIAIALFFTGAVFSQTTNPNTDKKTDMKDMRKDVRDVRKDKRQRTTELKHGNLKAARKTTKDIRSNKRDMSKDRKDLRKDGVKHPIRRADKQIHKQNQKMKQ